MLSSNSLLLTGLRSNHPSEACEHYYFSPHTWTVSILVAENRSSPCPFSGSYSVSGSSSSTSSPSSSRSSWILPPPEVSGDEDLAEKYQMLKEKENKNGDRCSTFMQVHKLSMFQGLTYKNSFNFEFCIKINVRYFSISVCGVKR